MGQSCSQNCSHLAQEQAFNRGCHGGNGGCVPPTQAARPHRDGGAGPSRRPRQVPRKDDELGIRFHASAFRISVETEEASAVRGGWRVSYALGPLLGEGISAKVYEAESRATSRSSKGQGNEAGGLWTTTCGGAGAPLPLHECFRERGRKVAIKCFNKVDSAAFQKELSALRGITTHPHILRLLESYHGFHGEDVVVLEHCDGSTLYDLYANEQPNGGIPERLVARLVHQLLLALKHLGACCVEHQDVKPENMLLYNVSLSSGEGELKLGDFGWAVMAPPPGAQPIVRTPPATGAGSLWYAPPEQNPPIEGITPIEGSGDIVMTRKCHGTVPWGQSDMWSVGVVLYLLLVGHSPFNMALTQQTPEAVEAEVLRLAALGEINQQTERWTVLHEDAQGLIVGLMQVRPCDRVPAAKALQHPFLARRVTRDRKGSLSFHGALGASRADREFAWRCLDGLQRLGWVAIARSVGEPELDPGVITGALEGMHKSESGTDPRETTYLWQLARELGTTPVFHWLHDRSAWMDVVRLAFCYLDTDGDGLLGPKDLASHIVHQSLDGASCHDSGHSAWAMASRWVSRWQDLDGPGSSTAHLTLEAFRDALVASHSGDVALLGGANTSVPNGNGHAGKNSSDANLDNYGENRGGEEEEISWHDMG